VRPFSEGKGGEEVRWLHGVGGGRQKKERHGGWRSKMIKGNWFSGLNARLGQTAKWAGKKNMVESMRCARKIGEGILAGQNRKEKGNKNREEFLGC
jgi:hypothetical protein